MSTTMPRSALAFISTSLLAATALAGDAAPDLARVATLEMEATIAAKPVVYLYLDPASMSLEVRSRGIVLDRVALEGIEVLTQDPLLDSPSPTPLQVPAIWTITSGAGDKDRELIAPSELRPYPGDDAVDDTPEPTPGGPPTPTPTPIPEPPASYRARLDSTWDLLICEQLPPTGAWQRFVAAVRDGWERLHGRGDDFPPTIALAMHADDARRIHHLMRTGTTILVAGS